MLLRCQLDRAAELDELVRRSLVIPKYDDLLGVCKKENGPKSL